MAYKRAGERRVSSDGAARVKHLRDRRLSASPSGARPEHPAALHRRGYAHGLAVFGHRAPGYIDAGLLEDIDDRIVGVDVALEFLAVDEPADLVADRLGGMGLVAAFDGGDRRGEEELHLEHPARGCEVFVGGHPADGGFVHADGVGDSLEVQRPQMLDAEGEETVLLADDLAGYLEDGLGPLVEALHQPGGGSQAVGDE